MNATELQIQVAPRSCNSSMAGGIDIPAEIDADFRDQWNRAEVAKMVEDDAIAARLWSTVGYSSGARLMAHLRTGHQHEQLDLSRNVSTLARALCDAPGKHLILMSPRLLDRARGNLPASGIPVVCMSRSDDVPVVQGRLSADASVVLSTPSLLARWHRSAADWKLAGIAQVHVATPVFHPHYLQWWRDALPQVESMTLLPAEGSWEEPLAHRVEQQMRAMISGGAQRHVIEHPDAADLIRLPMGLRRADTVREAGLAADVKEGLAARPEAAGRFQPLIEVALKFEQSGIRCFGPRADDVLAWMSEREPAMHRLISASKNLALAL